MAGATELAAHSADLCLTNEEFVVWADLLASKTGVVVPPERRMFLESNLRRRIRELQLSTFDQYHEQVRGPRGAMEWGTLVDRLTVHETHFFRHLPSYELVRSEVLPKFVEQRGADSFHAWSVGCSTGEEVWSLAMVIDHFASQQTNPLQYGITGSDVSHPALKTAREATYLRSNQAEVPKGFRSRYCTSADRQHFTIIDKLKKRVGFALLNLLHIDRQPMRDLDLIYCQNVLIYFPRDRRNLILEQFAQCLRPGGYLILGPGEITRWSHPTLQRVADTRALALHKPLGITEETKA